MTDSSVEAVARLIREHTDADTNDANYAATQIVAALPSPEREPMREALEAEVIEAARLFLKEGTRVTQRGDGYFFQQVIEKKDKSDPHYRLCVAVEKLDALAPPTAQSEKVK